MGRGGCAQAKLSREAKDKCESLCRVEPWFGFCYLLTKLGSRAVTYSVIKILESPTENKGTHKYTSQKTKGRRENPNTLMSTGKAPILVPIIPQIHVSPLVAIEQAWIQE